MIAKIKRISELAVIPTKGSEKSAGYDLYAALVEPIEIAPQRMVKIPTDLAITPPEGYAGWILPRSGMATKKGLRPANTPGLCDEDYTGNYIVALYNDSDEIQIVEPKDRIAQLVFLPYISVDFEEVETLNDTYRGDRGFGSTGV